MGHVGARRATAERPRALHHHTQLRQAWLGLLCFSVFALLFALPRSSYAETAVHSRSAQVMGTRLTIAAWLDDQDKAKADAAFDAVVAEFQRIDALMTSWGHTSDIAKLNAAGGVWQAVSAETLAILQRAQAMSRLSAGAFDVTVGAYRGIWKFDDDKDGSIPADSMVQARRAAVGYQSVELDTAGKRVRLRKPNAAVTLGGIAKGYAVDRGVAILRAQGIGHFLLQAGGDLFVSGKRGNRHWRAGIRDPRGAEWDVFASIELQDETFSTSGDYERGLVKNGKRYHHILDPATGYPAGRSRSVTVVAKDATTADAWSTALFVLGPERGLPLVEADPAVEAVWVDANNRVVISSGLTKRLHIVHTPRDGI